jgi:hypothetical protein
MTVRPPLPAADDEWTELLAKNAATEELESWRKSRRPKSGWDWNLETVIVAICVGIALVADFEIASLLL